MRLPKITLQHLRSAGIYCQPTISIERQTIANRWVVRGLESGGAVRDLGAYSSFLDADGNALPWIHSRIVFPYRNDRRAFSATRSGIPDRSALDHQFEESNAFLPNHDCCASDGRWKSQELRNPDLVKVDQRKRSQGNSFFGSTFIGGTTMNETCRRPEPSRKLRGKPLVPEQASLFG
jgi:hypothetical protein